MNILEKYISEIKGESFMSNEERGKLCRIVFYSRNKENVAKAKDKLIKGHLLLVVRRVLKLTAYYSPSVSDIMDLISEGNIALCKTVESYNIHYRGNSSFIPYIVKGIDHKVRKHARQNNLMYVPERHFFLNYKIKDLKEKYGQDISDRFVMDKLDVSSDMMERVKWFSENKIYLLEDVVRKMNDGNKKNINWEEFFPDIREKEKLDGIGRSDLQKFLLVKINNLLSDTERKVVFFIHFGEKEMNNSDIGKKLGMSRERIRQIYITALRKLKICLSSKDNLREIGL